MFKKSLVIGVISSIASFSLAAEKHLYPTPMLALAMKRAISLTSISAALVSMAAKH